MSADPLARLTHALADRYRVERAIGSGGMATVYLADDLKHRRQVAIKVLKPELAAAVGAERFLREIQIAAKLNFPHIVALFDTGEADGLVFYVMPYIAGESLGDRLRREKQLPIEDAIAIARQVAAALSYAADLGIVHRDIKPDNILLINETAMVTDFGIARVIAESETQRLTATGGTVGTPAYMSPEQAAGERALDARSDVYALACVVYESLAGQPPYTGPTALSIIAQHISSPVPQVRQIRKLVPDQVDRALNRALAKLPADRFATAHDFAMALTRADDPPQLDPTSTPARRAKPNRTARRAVSAVLAAGVLLALLVTSDRVGVRNRIIGIAGQTAAVDDGRRSVAVLPFQNVGAPDEEYFSDGLTEELIVALSQLRSLRVAARTSAFAFKQQTGDVREIARTLRVATVLLGSVRKTENRVRVTAQLVDATNGLDIWSETYEARNLSDIFDIQADMALRIARALEANLSASDRVRLRRKPTESVEAYTLYLKGRYFWGRRGEHLTTAIEYFNRAIAVDSQYARAYAGLAATFGPMGIQGYIQAQAGRDSMRTAALRAVELDDSLAEGHAALGACHHVYEWNWAAAEREYQRAVQLEPNFPTAHLWYGYLLETLGRFDEAIAERQRARDLDPLAPSAYTGLGNALLLRGRVDSAQAVYREGIRIDPEYWQAHEGLGVLLESAGQLEAARESFQRAVNFAGRTQRPKANLARVLALAKRTPEAAQLLKELRAQATQTRIHDPYVATALFASGDREGALAWLEEAYRERHPAMNRLKVDLPYAAMRREPRFQELVRRVGH